MSAGLEIEDVMRELKSTRSTLTRYESGHVLPAWGSVLAMFAFFGASDDQREEASRLYDVAADEPPPVRLPAGAPKAYRRLVNAERDGKIERSIEPWVVPGLLQTEPYAHALHTVAARYTSGDDAQVEGYVKRRLSRQQRFTGERPMELHAIIDESVIHRPIGGPRVLRGQLEHLLVMGERPNVTVQVVAYAVGAYGLGSGPVTIVTYDDDTSGVYLEYPAGGDWVENPKDVQRFTTMFHDIAQVALSPDETAKLIRRRAQALEDK
jgi:hypothetical protein